MSLVVNANKSTNGVFMQSNEGIVVSYPDFDQILVKPACEEVNIASSNPVAFTVNGTNVNFLNARLYNPFSTGIMGTYGQRSIIDSSDADGVSTLIQGTSPLLGGEIIGEQVVYRIQVKTYNQTQNTASGNIKIGLLHTDGSITYGAEGSFSEKTSNYTYQKNSYTLSGYHTINHSGLVAVEGDIVVVYLELKSSNSGQGISFGFDGGSTGGSYQSDNPFGPTPIQISIR